MKTLVLEPPIISRIGGIGRVRRPAEACGILLNAPWKGQRVWELPNRSKMPQSEFELWGSDISIVLEGVPSELLVDLAFWHTHPNGRLGPSQTDRENRLEEFGNLVVSLDGDEDIPFWF